MLSFKLPEKEAIVIHISNDIDYRDILKRLDTKGDYEKQIKLILPALLVKWKQTYCKMGNPNPYIMLFPFDTYEILFDQIEEYPDDEVDTAAEIRWISGYCFYCGYKKGDRKRFGENCGDNCGEDIKFSYK